MKLNYNKVEILIATAAFFYWIVYYVNNAFFILPDVKRYEYFLGQIIRAITLYCGFMYLNFIVLKGKTAKFKLARVSIQIILVYIIAALLFYFASYHQKLTESLLKIASQLLLFLGLFFAYREIRDLIKEYVTDPKKSNHVLKKLRPKLLIATGYWAIVVIAFKILELTPMPAEIHYITVSLFTVVPYIYLLYILCLYFWIPAYKNSEIFFGLFLLKTAFRSFGLFVLWIVSGIGFFGSGDMIIVWWSFAFLTTLTYALYIYHRNRKHIEKLISLEIALENSSSNLQFLRSQINPHFLFNTLNALYSAALIDKSERTAEGIQKLGDMMRFFLHENNQDKILLSKEIGYIRNYINLQQMRIQSIEKLALEIDIDEIKDDTSIAPMLLIPFIENAFKHGISIANQSFIIIRLQLIGTDLHFSVSNSIHPKSNTNIEQNSSGIGLKNVKQRLNLLYPERHQLNILEKAQEFTSHLTIKL